MEKICMLHSTMELKRTIWSINAWRFPLEGGLGYGERGKVCLRLCTIWVWNQCSYMWTNGEENLYCKGKYVVIICVIYCLSSVIFQIMFLKLHFNQHSGFFLSILQIYTFFSVKDLLDTLNFILVGNKSPSKAFFLARDPVNPKIFHISYSPLFFYEMSVSFD